MTVTIPAYAKINLFLDICSIRNDGYHNILSIMQAVSLHDRVSVELLPKEKKQIEVFCDHSSIPSDKSNLAYKAADRFPIESGHIRIKIEKSIPFSAGLGGGSADAAATLMALNQLTGNKLSVTELCSIGAKIGADVPFCIKGGACRVEGIGDILTPCQTMPSFPIVIAKKGDGMSTPEAYGALDAKYDRFASYTPHYEQFNVLNSPDDRQSIEHYCMGLYNIFESTVEPARPTVTVLKEALKTAGATAAMMSGSGTSVFGIFKNENDAQNAVRILKEQGADAHLCYPV